VKENEKIISRKAKKKHIGGENQPASAMAGISIWQRKAEMASIMAYRWQ
jgi:hypothetical protein